ncbi:hypothetical protein AVEN_40101-1 [Araneus ventricosus]|uniref:Uncharacterized protein n=1 Tax=Araneus ventricosus TaxID=182803 RepID=A0A4Y2IZK0_ARAVE|nr:hypothetical protein AVEN_40101-1 [Araneus ventricosus]
MCFQRREFSDLNDPEFQGEIVTEIPIPILIQALEQYLANLLNMLHSTQPLGQNLANLEDMQDSTTTTDTIRSPRLFSMAFIKMKLKHLMRSHIVGLFWIIVFLLVLPEKTSMVFINPVQIIPSDIGCPDDTKCNIACQEDPLFNSKGSCVGPDKTLCSCGPPHNTTDLPIDTEATVCNDRECEWKCAEYRMPMTGKCTEGVCKCGYNVTVTGFQQTEILPSKYCFDPCCIPFPLSFVVECHDGKVLARKGMFNWPKQVADLIGAFSAVEGE